MVVFNIATIPRRKKSLLSVLEMLKNQTVKCDEINVALSYPNFDTDVNNLLKRNFTKYHILWRSGMTCEHKMFNIDKYQNDYFLTFDDDIVYPEDYAQKLIEGIDNYNKECVIGFHGIIFDKFPVINYKKQKTMYQYFKEVKRDKEVNVIGTGCLGFHTSKVNPSFEQINNNINCLDGSFGRWCRDYKKRMIVLAHKPAWMNVYPESQDAHSLWQISYREKYKKKLSFLSQ